MSTLPVSSGLNAAVTAATSRFTALDVVANNIANANTVGYKRDVPCFDAVLKNQPGQNASLGDITLRETVVDQRPGSLKATGNPFDVAIESEGYFEVETAQGLRYTRQGNFALDGQRRLVTSDGDPVLVNGNPLTIPGNDLAILPDGTLESGGATLGRLNLFRYPPGFRPVKENAGLYLAPRTAQMEAVEAPLLRQGHLEEANINLLQEMSRMIEYQREFETFQKMIKTYNTLAGKAEELGSL